MNNVGKCKFCGKDYLWDSNLRKLGYRKNRCNSCGVTAYRKRRKKKLIEYKGGCCEICGYNKCIDALEFHHLDPTKKDFNISKNGTCRTTDEDKREVDKCILVCANCHRETHEKKFEPILENNHWLTNRVCKCCNVEFKPKRREQVLCSVKCKNIAQTKNASMV